MFDSLFGYEARRKRLLKKAPEGALKNFLSVPFPDPKTSLDEIPILSVDFETTGLSPKKDQILSVGFIDVVDFEIKLASAYHQVIQTKGELSEENVVIHQIMDDTKDQGEQLQLVVEKLLAALAGKAMLVHFGRIEKNFLDAVCNKLYGMAPIYPIIDTLVLAKRRKDRHQAAYDPGELRLFTLREQYVLPQYNAHNALCDALATAELFFAEVAAMNNKVTPLKTVLS